MCIRDRKASPLTKLFVLDTNVLLHDPTSVYRFEEHDVFLPIMTLEELDNNKKGLSEVSRNARQVTRTLDEIVSSHSQGIEKMCIRDRACGLVTSCTRWRSI